jgi:SAM-dependent methyltransferase
MNLRKRLHEQVVHVRRVEVLSEHLATLVKPGSTLLDVGCGDGLLSKRISESVDNLTVSGVDVMERNDTHIPVQTFDGVSIPFDDKSYDVVMFVDVLHHTTNPSVLLNEATRIAREAIIIKDHRREGFLANATLRLMDWCGNAQHGVALPYNYLSRREWDALFQDVNLIVDDEISCLGLYPFPANLLFDRSLHFIARLRMENVS